MRRFADAIAWLALFLFGFVSLANAQTNRFTATNSPTANPCVASQTNPPAPLIFKITVRNLWHRDQLNYRIELRDLLTEILRKDSQNKVDVQDFKRLKKLASKIKFKE